MDRLYWVKDPKILSAFEKFVEQKWKDAAVAAAEPVGWGHLCLNQSRQCCWQGKKMKFPVQHIQWGPNNDWIGPESRRGCKMPVSRILGVHRHMCGIFGDLARDQKEKNIEDNNMHRAYQDCFG
jgi:hypothetical protein